MAIILASKSPRRQELMRERFEQMIAYAANEQECRSAVLERYFGEENPAPCGVCDICLARKRAAKAAAREAGTAPGTALPEAAGDAPGSESALREKLLARLARSPARRRTGLPARTAGRSSARTARERGGPDLRRRTHRAFQRSRRPGQGKIARRRAAFLKINA